MERKMTLIKRADIVADAPARWAKQYDYSNDAGKADIGHRLASLPEGFTAEQVVEIIGNTSWTVCECDMCGGDHEFLVRLGENPDYEARWIDICHPCLSSALDFILIEALVAINGGAK